MVDYAGAGQVVIWTGKVYVNGGMRPLNLSCLHLAAALTVGLTAAGPACAGIFKWVDENGVVNYSTTPPAKAAGKALEIAESRLSVYTPVTPAQPRRDSATDSLRARVEQLEDQLAAERRRRTNATQASDEQRKRAYEECLRSRAVDCDPDRLTTTASAVYPFVSVRRPAAIIIPTLPVTPRPVAAPAPGPGWGKPSTTRWK